MRDATFSSPLASTTFTIPRGNVDTAGERRAIRSMIQGHRAAYLGGLAAATAAGAAGAIVYANRARRVRTAS